MRTKTEDKSREEVAKERLRQSRKQLESELRERGQNAGAEFVLNDDAADAALERRLLRLDEDTSGRGMPTNFSALTELLAGESGYEADYRETFSDEADDIDEPEWIEGFIKGALDQFKAL